jgi:hypothetical protein
MPDDPSATAKTPEEIAADKAAEVETARVAKAAEQAELAKVIGTAIGDQLAAREAAAEKNKPVTAPAEPEIETIDPAEIDRRIKNGEPIADLITKFGAGVEERTRRAVLAETGGAVRGLQEVVLNQARKEIAHFTEYEDEITKIVNRVKPENRTLKTYQDATAMVLGRPDVAKKLRDVEVAAEVEKVLGKKKEGVGAAETGAASRVVRTAGAAEQKDGKLAATEENLRLLVGEDSYHAFLDLKRSRGVTLDLYAQRLGYPDAQAWFDRAVENDRRSATEGLGLDR